MGPVGPRGELSTSGGPVELLRPAGAGHVLWPPLCAERCAWYRGLCPLRASVHVFRALSLTAADAHPHLHARARRSSYGRIHPSRLAGDRCVQLGAPLALTAHDSRAGSAGVGGGRIVRSLRRGDHRGFGPRGPGCRALGLQRRLCLERGPHDRQPLRPPGRAGTPLVGPGARRRRPDPGDQSRPGSDGIRLRHRRRFDRRVVRIGPRRRGEPALVLAHAGGGGRAIRSELRGDVREVRNPRGASHGRPGVGASQRTPALFP